MARRRSPMHRLNDDPSEFDSSSDDARPAEDELMLDEEDPQHYLEKPLTGLRGMLRRLRGNRHAHHPIPMSSNVARLHRRKSRKRDVSDKQDERSLIFEANGAEGSHEDGLSRSYDDIGLDRDAINKISRCQGWTNLCRVCLIGTLVTCFGSVLIILVLWMAYSEKGPREFAAPIARPSIFFNNGTSNFGPTTILISLDGFRADFLDRGLTPALSSFISSGVSPKYMLPSFPSVTFPNHWTMVTGMYPESHGVVGNSFWDEALAEQFFYTNPARSMFPKWWASTGAEPIWATAEKQGIRSGIHMWPGSEAGLQPAPAHLDEYNSKEKLSAKVDKVLSWIDLPSPFDGAGGTEAIDQSLTDPRPQLIAMYVPDVDRDGHKFGPNSTEIRATISAADEMVGMLLSGLDSRNLTDIVNVIVVSDHGMATTSRTRLVQFEDLVDPDLIDHVDGWPLYGLRPKVGVDVQGLYTALTAQHAVAGDKPGWSVYTRESMPTRWHFSSNPRIAPLFLVPDAGWSIVTRKELDLSDPANEHAVYHPRGIHGYDHEHPLMRAIFAARGPSFPHPQGSRVSPFQNTEVYGIVCQTLGIVAKGNNGTLKLPFAPEGLHGDGKEGDNAGEIVDWPDDDAAMVDSGVDTGAVKVVGEGDAPETSGFKGKLQEIWHSVVGKLGEVKAWVTDAFGTKKLAPSE